MSGGINYDEKHAAVNEQPAPAYTHFDAETGNIGGEFPMHPAPKGPHESVNDLKEELEHESPELDLYTPFPIDPDIPEEENILTVRGKSVCKAPNSS